MSFGFKQNVMQNMSKSQWPTATIIHGNIYKISRLMFPFIRQSMDKVPGSGETIASSIHSLYHDWLDSLMFIVSKIRVYFGDIYPGCL